MRTVNPVNHRKQTDHIVNKACALFAKNGYGRTSMQMIAEACRLTKPTLYHYFRNKSELLHVLLTRRNQTIQRLLIDQHQAPDLESKLRGMGMAFMNSLKNKANRDFMQLLIRDSFNDPAVRRILTADFNQRTSKASGCHAAGPGGCRVPVTAVHQFMGALLCYAVEVYIWKTSMIRCGDEAYVRSLAQVFAHGLPGRRAGSAPASH